MKSFRAYQLAIEFHRSCQSLELKGEVRKQFERAVLSIPLNLAEGGAKPTRKDRRRFYFTALGSLREVQAVLELYGTPVLKDQADKLGAYLYRLCQRA